MATFQLQERQLSPDWEDDILESQPPDGELSQTIEVQPPFTPQPSTSQSSTNPPPLEPLNLQPSQRSRPIKSIWTIEMEFKSEAWAAVVEKINHIDGITSITAKEARSKLDWYKSIYKE
ncbi:hypothetical protein B7463_g10279, partial [Scytalidium lignicola]